MRCVIFHIFIFYVSLFTIDVYPFQSARKSDYILPGLIIMVALNGIELPPERRIESTPLLPVFKSHIKMTFSQVVNICLYFVHFDLTWPSCCQLNRFKIILYLDYDAIPAPLDDNFNELVDFSSSRWVDAVFEGILKYDSRFWSDACAKKSCRCFAPEQARLHFPKSIWE